MIAPTVLFQERGQVTIPKEFRKRLDLKQGDLITSIETKEGVIINPAKLVVSAVQDEIGEVLKEKGINLEEIMELGKEIRNQLLEEEQNIKDLDIE